MTQLLDKYSSSNSTTSPSFAHSSGSSSIHELSLLSRVLSANILIQNNPFQQLIKKRINYLNSLYSLGDNWCSGESHAPEQNSIYLMKKFLLKLSNISKLNERWEENSKLLMSPVPEGGVSLNINHLNFSIMLTIFNTQEIEIEFEKDGFYDEIDSLTSENFLEQTENLILKLLESV